MRDPGKARICATEDISLSEDPFEVVGNPEIAIVVEVIGGTGLARELVLRAIDQGKHVVTANKALIALHGNEVFAAAHEKGVTVAFEAAVAGGVPIIKAIREGLAGNRIDRITGIVNGTSNYILSEMRDHRRDFDDVLAEASAPRLCGGGSHFRRGRDRCSSQAHHSLRHRLRYSPPVLAGAYGGHRRPAPGRHRLRRAARLPHSPPRHRPSQRRRRRVAGAPHPGTATSPARRCGRSDECGAGGRGCGGSDVVLRRGSRRGGHRFRGSRGSRRRGARAHHGSREPSAAPRLPAGRDVQPRRARHGRCADRLLPAHDGVGSARRSRRDRDGAGTRRDQHRGGGAAGAPARGRNSPSS